MKIVHRGSLSFIRENSRFRNHPPGSILNRMAVRSVPAKQRRHSFIKQKTRRKNPAGAMVSVKEFYCPCKIASRWVK
jgi:hypothetical protein